MLAKDIEEQRVSPLVLRATRPHPTRPDVRLGRELQLNIVELRKADRLGHLQATGLTLAQVEALRAAEPHA